MQPMDTPLIAVSNEGRAKNRAADKKSKAIKEQEQAAPSVNADAENSSRRGKSKSGNGKAIFKGAVKNAATFTAHTVLDFDSEMKRLTDITACSPNEAEALRDRARELGTDYTLYNALEVAHTMLLLSEVGHWTAAQILNGTEGVLSIARASGDDLAAVASDTAPAIMDAFEMEPESAPHLADVLVSASEYGKVTVHKLLEALRSTPAIGKYYSLEHAVILLTVILKDSRVSTETAASALEAEARRHQTADPMTFSAVGPFPIRSSDLRHVAAAVRHCDGSAAKRAAQKPTVTELLLMIKSLVKEFAIILGDVLIWPILRVIADALRFVNKNLRTSRIFRIITVILVAAVFSIALLIVFY